MKWNAHQASRVPTWKLGTSFVSASIAVHVHTDPTMLSLSQFGFVIDRFGRIASGTFLSFA